VTDRDELLRLLDLPPDDLPPGPNTGGFALRVPRGFIARMAKGDPADALLRQVLPVAREDVPQPGFTADPVGDRAAVRAPGLLHKYHGRVLLNLTPACAIHCRYCFRREFPYAEAGHGRGTWGAALAYIRADASIHEVILSGGDPLALADSRLAALVGGLAEIPHLRRLRLHTRLPVVLPERVDADLLGWLGATRLSPVVVVHANHPNELDHPVTAALQGLRRAGAAVLNQSVLLRGVNDAAPTLAALSEALFAAGALPYYLHMLDRVRGAAHFEVDRERALALHAALRARLPGYLVPRLVRETAGEASKGDLMAP
jgi:EF-P beta-lysylation protein EpmB